MIWQIMKLAYRLASIMATRIVWQSKKMKTSYPLRVQAIRSRGQNPRLYISFPLALAAALGAMGYRTRVSPEGPDSHSAQYSGRLAPQIAEQNLPPPIYQQEAIESGQTKVCPTKDQLFSYQGHRRSQKNLFSEKNYFSYYSSHAS